MINLLPSNSLKDICLGLSVSESPDLNRLGLLETHLQLALAEIARCILVAGGKLAYGGHLLPGGYTSFLVKELHKYGRRDRPLLICLAWQEHRRFSLTELNSKSEDLGLYGKIISLDPDGQEINIAEGRSEDAQVPGNPELRKKALSSMRRYMGSKIQGRILIGGKRHGFQGKMPGLMEEALISLEMQQPLYLAGGFGGVTTDIIEALEIDDGNWLPRKPHTPPEDQRLSEGKNRLHQLTKSPKWSGMDNGLSPEENQHLATTHRPSEIATLVSLGLGRYYLNSRDD